MQSRVTSADLNWFGLSMSSETIKYVFDVVDRLFILICNYQKSGKDVE